MSNTTTEFVQPTPCVVVIENQRIPLPSTTISDHEICKMITPFWPAAANAEIKRETKDGVLEITLVKRPGTKGSSVLAALLDRAEDDINPAIAMYYRLMKASADKQLDLTYILQNRVAIQAAMDAGQEAAEGVRHALHALQRARPSPLNEVPLGF